VTAVCQRLRPLEVSCDACAPSDYNPVDSVICRQSRWESSDIGAGHGVTLEAGMRRLCVERSCVGAVVSLRASI